MNWIFCSVQLEVAELSVGHAVPIGNVALLGADHSDFALLQHYHVHKRIQTNIFLEKKKHNNEARITRQILYFIIVWI